MNKNFHILALSGANLNLLGKREVSIYGKTTLDDIHARMLAINAHTHCVQSNHEGVLIDTLHSHFDVPFDGVIINPAGFTHTSVALLDALLATSLPFVEVHLSNIHAREPFRQHSFFSAHARGVICGLGAYGYECAMRFLLDDLTENKPCQY